MKKRFDVGPEKWGELKDKKKANNRKKKEISRKLHMQNENIVII